MQPSDSLDTHFRLSAAQKSALKRLRIATVEDVLRHFPTRYESSGSSGRSDALVPGTSVTLTGSFTKLEAKKLWRSRRPATEGVFQDSAGKVKVLWFNQPYIAKMTSLNTPVKISGSVAGSEKSPYITNPEITALPAGSIDEGMFETLDESGDPKLFPVYPESRGVTSRWFFHAIQKIFASGVLERMHDSIPKEVLETYHLPSLQNALIWVHTPEKKSHTDAARKRFSFEEMFLIQVAKQQDRQLNDAQTALSVSVDEAKNQAFIETLPYALTGAQQRAVGEILNDFKTNRPMARLLEGDVGSGKTAVAAVTSYAAVTSRPPDRNSGTLQVAYMAPTEILATQHFESFIELFGKLPINIGLITGSGCYKFPSKLKRDEPTKISRAQLLKWVANGEIAMLIGTHALIQKSVVFQNLAYVIVDEQHRFGTAQRRALARKSETMPHFLSMTATPIPRTLALTIYGDLDISVLDELPPGRADIKTSIVTKAKRDNMYEQIRTELADGRQAYVICPRIDEPDPEKALAIRAKSAKAEADRLQKSEFSDFNVGLLHGKMKPDEKDAVMSAFASGEIDVLVATSVVEVGVNVPNATSIIIEGAERFGLSQLHQLRGRVLRSSHEARCFLVPEKVGAPARERLTALSKTRNGFELAEADLKQRGAGDLYGAKQWGITDIGMEALQNPRLIEAARTEARNLVEGDPHLSKHHELLARSTALREQLHDE